MVSKERLFGRLARVDDQALFLLLCLVSILYTQVMTMTVEGFYIFKDTKKLQNMPI